MGGGWGECSLIPGRLRTAPPSPPLSWAAGAGSPGKPDRQGQKKPQGAFAASAGLTRRTV